MKKRIDVYSSNIYNNQLRSLISLRILVLLTLLAFLFLPIISAAENDTEQAKVNKAYSCLQDKAQGNCDSLSVEEKTFSVMATNQCRQELLDDSSDSGECWGSSAGVSCKVKETAQAMIALKSSGSAQDWLYSKNITPKELSWFLEIESPESTTCTISYSSSSYTLNIGEDKKISSGAGSCLVLAQGNYWLRVSPSCYNTEFTVSCDQSFLTTTLFRKTAEADSTIRISDTTSSAAAGGSTKETIKSYCFADAGNCNYEATLWAALALDSQEKEVNSYLPYLITFADDNQRYLPDSFLFALTAKTEYKTIVLSKQKSSQYWQESGDKYYDTALALYPLKQDNSQEKTNAKTWLLNSQDSNGCWENNLRNTAFVLASVWPRTFSDNGGGGGSLPDCEEAGYYCTTSAQCSSGSKLAEYDCPGISQICCSTQPEVKTCSEQGGEICIQSESCFGGTKVSASDLRSTEVCCAAGGDCRPVSQEEESTCTLYDGTCRASSCTDNEEESSYSCDFSGDICCIQKSTSDEKSYLWVWIFLILIVLVVLGIIFRNKLRMLWFRIGHHGGPKPSAPGPHMPHFPQSIQRPIQRIERRIFVPQHAPVKRPSPLRTKSGAEKELDDVLRKLKDMGK